MPGRFKVGDKVLRCDLDDPTSIVELTVTKVSQDTVQCGGPEEVYYTSFLWPASVRGKLIAITAERARLKKAYEDSMTLVYQLGNEIARELEAKNKEAGRL